MARAFAAADLIQHNSGSSVATASVTVSLPNPTTEGNTVDGPLPVLQLVGAG
jgi:hypothetical protein